LRNFIEELIKDGIVRVNGEKNNIYSHSDQDHSKFERYNEHAKKTRLVMHYFMNQEEELIKDFHNDFKKNYSLQIPYEDFEELILNFAELHDLGKINPLFQKDKFQNIICKNIPPDVRSEHSLMSAILFAMYVLEKFNLEENKILLILPHIIYGHHTRLRSIHEAESTSLDGRYGLFSLSSQFGESYSAYETTLAFLIKLYGFQETSIFKLRNIHNQFYDLIDENVSTLSIFYNYLYSLLTKADIISSSHSFSSLSNFKKALPSFYRRIDNEMLQRISEGIEERQNKYREQLGDNPLNPVRKMLYEEALKGLNKGYSGGKSVFYLKMPTGAGKTHTALGLSKELLKLTEANRIVYALPFISLLEQNYRYLRDTLNLKINDEIRSIYSLSNISFTNGNNKEVEDIITYDDFFEYPVICTTTVSLFNTIVKFKKRNKYRFSSLTNSIIIIDEVQTLPVKYWSEFNYLLNEMAENLGLYIIIMSATVPRLEGLKHNRELDPVYSDKVHYLIKDAEVYYEHFERNHIVNDQIETIEIDDTSEELINSIFDKCIHNFEDDHNHGLVVVNTVHRSREVYEKLIEKFQNNGYASVQCILLNSTILPAKKDQIVRKINNINAESKMILISTQSVEAGLDVSFHFVIRDVGTLESIEQVRGRCNRSKEIEVGEVYLIDIIENEKSEASKVYSNWRLDLTKSLLKKNKLNYDITDLNHYFERTLEKLNQEISTEYKLNAADNITCWNRLKYEENEYIGNQSKNVFHVDVIEEKQNAYQFFVETELPINMFSDEEIEFLKNTSYSCFDGSDAFISGKKLLELYRQELEESKGDFVKKKIIKRTFSSVISKFVFSSLVTISEHQLEGRLQKVGSYFVINNDDVGDMNYHLYSIEKGFDRAQLSDAKGIII